MNLDLSIWNSWKLWITSTIIAGRGLSVKSSATVLKATMRSVLGYATEMIPMHIVSVGLLEQLEILQRRSLRALLDASEICINEGIEYDVGFNKV